MTTAIREKPILFSAPMVRAILDGRKTMTRRVVSARNSTVLGYPGCQLWDRLRFDYDKDGRSTYVDGPNNTFFGCGPNVQYLHVPAFEPGADESDPDNLVVYRVRPVFEIGDRLWVRETFDWVAGTETKVRGGVVEKRWLESLVYKAGGTLPPSGKWTSPLFMPRWASRITLEITGVKVERVQAISEADAIAEGVTPKPIDCRPGFSYREEFRDLWDSINGKKHPWKSNCWVWILEFKRATP